MRHKIPYRIEKTNSRSKFDKNQKSFPTHLRNIRACGCLICGKEAEAAHLRYSSAEYGKINSGVGSKPHDKFTVPLCPGHHRLDRDCQHNGNELEFWDRHKIDPLSVAAQLWDARDDLAKMQVIAATAKTK
jgi:hypothetical protein